MIGYRNVEEVLDAVKNKEVDGALLDMYATAIRKDLFEDKDIELNRLLKYPSGYGLVLSGRMKDSAMLTNRFLLNHKAEVSKLIEENTDVIRQV